VVVLVGYQEEMHPVPPYSPAVSTDKLFFIADSDSSSNLAYLLFLLWLHSN